MDGGREWWDSLATRGVKRHLQGTKCENGSARAEGKRGTHHGRPALLSPRLPDRGMESHPRAARFRLERTMNPGHFGVSETAIAIALANDNPGPANYQNAATRGQKRCNSIAPLTEVEFLK